MCDPLNVKEIAEAKPDFMGFIFYSGSPRYVGGEPDMDLFLNVPSATQKTGVFVNEDPDKILDLTRRTGIDLVQLHGNEPADYCSQLRSSGIIIIKAFGITEYFDFEKLKPYIPACDYFLFDTKTEKFGGSGLKFDWTKIDEYHLEKPFFLSGGIGPEDASLIKQINHKNLFAVDINSRFEIRPGIKDREKVEAFIDEIKR